MMEQLATVETLNSRSLSAARRAAVTSNNGLHIESEGRWHVRVCGGHTYLPAECLSVCLFLRISTLCYTSPMHTHTL